MEWNDMEYLFMRDVAQHRGRTIYTAYCCTLTHLIDWGKSISETKLNVEMSRSNKDILSCKCLVSRQMRIFVVDTFRPIKSVFWKVFYEYRAFRMILFIHLVERWLWEYTSQVDETINWLEISEIQRVLIPSSWQSQSEMRHCILLLLLLYWFKLSSNGNSLKLFECNFRISYNRSVIYYSHDSRIFIRRAWCSCDMSGWKCLSTFLLTTVSESFTVSTVVTIAGRLFTSHCIAWRKTFRLFLCIFMRFRVSYTNGLNVFCLFADGTNTLRFHRGMCVIHSHSQLRRECHIRHELMAPRRVAGAGKANHRPS